MQKNWGWYLVWLEIIASVVTVCLRPVGGHYIVFSEPAGFLWHGRNPYGALFTYGVGGYFYSPACAMFFFSLFAWMSPKTGQFVYLMVSLGTFWLGLRFFLRSLKTATGWDFATSPYRNIVWMMIGSELIGAILAVKVEIVMLGAALFAVGLMLTGRRYVLAGVILGVLCNWKFQPLPLVLLTVVALALLRPRGALQFAAGFLGAFLILYPLPFPFQSWEFTQSVHRAWKDTLSEYMHRDWLIGIYHHIYAFMARGLGHPISFEQAGLCSVAIGAAFCLLMAEWLRRLDRGERNEAIQPFGILLALSLGASFIVLCSPLSQSNGYIWYTPAAIVVAFFAERARANEAWVKAALLGAFFLVSLLYSDAVPRLLSRHARDAGVKPLGVILLLVALACLCREITRANLALRPAGSAR